jgi:2-methylcitrate dehydratase PrpD
VPDNQQLPSAPIAAWLATWADELDPSVDDLALARRSLIDTLAVSTAGRDHEDAPLSVHLGQAGRWAMLAHLIDFDDLHVPSTSHISAVCVPAALAARADARAYLAGAGVMARLGVLLGWRHFDRGWHATCTAGAPAAAVAAGVGMGLNADELATAIVHALPAAGGVRQSFGTAGKALQVGFAVDAGVRAATLSAAGATANVSAMEQWLELVGADGTILGTDDKVAIPGGLAVKLHPCCYAMQRPIAAVREALGGARVAAQDIRTVTVRCPSDTLRPLIHHRPQTGLEAKFSLEYAVAAAVLDDDPGLASFTDEAVRRHDAQGVMRRVSITATEGGGGLLAGRLEVDLVLTGGRRRTATIDDPPGVPDRTVVSDELRRKIESCALPDSAAAIVAADWPGGSDLAAVLLDRPADDRRVGIRPQSSLP